MKFCVGVLRKILFMKHEFRENRPSDILVKGIS